MSYRYGYGLSGLAYPYGGPYGGLYSSYYDPRYNMLDYDFRPQYHTEVPTYTTRQSNYNRDPYGLFSYDPLGYNDYWKGDTDYWKWGSLPPTLQQQYTSLRHRMISPYDSSFQRNSDTGPIFSTSPLYNSYSTGSSAYLNTLRRINESPMFFNYGSRSNAFSNNMYPTLTKRSDRS